MSVTKWIQSFLWLVYVFLCIFTELIKATSTKQQMMNNFLKKNYFLSFILRIFIHLFSFYIFIHILYRNHTSFSNSQTGDSINTFTMPASVARKYGIGSGKRFASHSTFLHYGKYLENRHLHTFDRNLIIIILWKWIVLTILVNFLYLFFLHLLFLFLFM